MEKQKAAQLPNQDLLNQLPLAILPLEHFSSLLTEVPHSHNAYMLMLVQEANGGDNLIDFKRYDLQPGRLFFVKPGQAHQRHAKQEKGLLISFSEAFLQTTGTRAADVLLLFGNLYQHPYLDLPPYLLSVIEPLARLMKAELQQRQPDWHILAQYLYILLRYLLLESQAVIAQLTPPRHSERLFRLSQLLERHYHEHRSIAFYAQALAITPKHLNSLCRQYMQTTVADMQHERLLLESKRLLCFSSVSVKEIAFQLGFEDASYFTRFFKRLTGLTPLQFRSKGSESTVLAAENPAE